MVEVFKTNVKRRQQAAELLSALSHQFPAHCINFDLDDGDKILRIEGDNICTDTIIGLLSLQGYKCEILV